MPELRADPRAADLLLPKGPLATISNSYKVLGCRFLTKYICTEPGTVNFKKKNSIQKNKSKKKKSQKIIGQLLILLEKILF